MKDSLVQGFEVPKFYIIPDNKYDFIDGITLMEIEFPIYYNFFFKKTKTTFICQKQFKQTVLNIFQETLLGPKCFKSFHNDFVNQEEVFDIEKELQHFAKNPFKKGEKFELESFIEFIFYDKKNQAVIQDENNKSVIKIVKKKNTYNIY